MAVTSAYMSTAIGVSSLNKCYAVKTVMQIIKLPFTFHKDCLKWAPIATDMYMYIYLLAISLPPLAGTLLPGWNATGCCHIVRDLPGLPSLDSVSINQGG